MLYFLCVGHSKKCFTFIHLTQELNELEIIFILQMKTTENKIGYLTYWKDMQPQVRQP